MAEARAWIAALLGAALLAGITPAWAQPAPAAEQAAPATSAAHPSKRKPRARRIPPPPPIPPHEAAMLPSRVVKEAREKDPLYAAEPAPAAVAAEPPLPTAPTQAVTPPTAPAQAAEAPAPARPAPQASEPPPALAQPTPPPAPEPPAMPSRQARKPRPDLCVENATIDELAAALTHRKLLAVDLVRAYLARIEAYDQQGPALNAVREVNPDAIPEAASIDARPLRRTRLPLQGIPILLKDNIATGDNQHTTAGSLALADAHAKGDATVAARLRAAGAVIIGKANLTEFANILALGMPSGYSSLGGQVRNAYAPQLDAKGVPIVTPGGSSAGSAVAVAAGFAAAAIGTETSGSLLSPAGQNGLVTVKPTVGLVSRAGIIPIADSQDTAGPIARTVRDAAIILGVLAGPDKADPATAKAPAKPVDYLKALDKDGLKGARIGVPSNPADPANDVYWRPLSPQQRAVMDLAIQALRDQGAEIIRENLPTEGWIGGPGTEMALLNRNPESPDFNRVARLPIVFVYELKHDLNLYLKDWARGTSMRTLGDIIGFNAAHADRALRFGQDIFLAAEATRGDLKDIEYMAARQMDLRASRARGLDIYMDENRLDAVLFPGNGGAGIAAKAGYPSVQVPAGWLTTLGGKEVPEYPMGATFTGRAWSEATLLRIAYAFEQATQVRKMPPNVPALVQGCDE